MGPLGPMRQMGERVKFPGQRTALVIGHPGHELRVHGWLEISRPTVFVLTDGSGSTGQGRLASTTRILNQTGSRPGGIYGRFTDAEIYDALLRKDHNRFICLAEELASSLDAKQVTYVVGDAWEGYNPTHDVCRLLIDSAIQLVRSYKGLVIGNYEFALAGKPDEQQGAVCPGTIRLRLGEAAFARKQAAARAYSAMAAEVNTALERFGADAFHAEHFCPVVSEFGSQEQFQQPPYYERYGAAKVAAGVYRELLSFTEHIQPLARALKNHCQRKVACVA